MFGIGNMELVILCIVALLLFGNRLPSVMRGLGSSITQFKKGLSDVSDEIGANDIAKTVKKELKEAEKVIKS